MKLYNLDFSEVKGVAQSLRDGKTVEYTTTEKPSDGVEIMKFRERIRREVEGELGYEPVISIAPMQKNRMMFVITRPRK